MEELLAEAPAIAESVGREVVEPVLTEPVGSE